MGEKRKVRQPDAIYDGYYIYHFLKEDMTESIAQQICWGIAPIIMFYPCKALQLMYDICANQLERDNINYVPTTIDENQRKKLYNYLAGRFFGVEYEQLLRDTYLPSHYHFREDVPAEKSKKSRKTKKNSENLD